MLSRGFPRDERKQALGSFSLCFYQINSFLQFCVLSLICRLRYAFVLDWLRKPILMEMSRDTDLSPLESTDKDPLL